MFFICPGCGEWSNERPVQGETVVCECGYRHPIALRPLLLVTGASGSGKSTVALRLAGTFTQAVVLDQDLLWMPEMDTYARGQLAALSQSLAPAGREYPSK